MNRIGLSCIAVLFLCGAVHAESPVMYVCRDSAHLDTFFLAKMDTFHLPGLAAGVIKDGEIIWTGTYGWAKIEDSIPVTDTTSFNLGSVSKLVTAVAAMQAWEQNLFELDDDINDYLPFAVRNPYYPDDSITPFMLLTHTSSIIKNNGIIDPLNVFGGDSPIPLDTFLYNYLNPAGYWYDPSGNFSFNPPGTTWEYSGPGICLGGYFVQTVTGDSFPIFCQQHIFDPLYMPHTAWFYADLDTNNVAMSYYYSGGQYFAYGYPGKPTYPSGNLKSSLRDLSRFLTMFMQYGELDSIRIMDSTTVAIMRTVYCPIIGYPNSYQGIGWWYYESSHRYCWGHAGLWWGASAYMEFCPEENSGAIILVNAEIHVFNYLAAWTHYLLDWAEQYGIEENESVISPCANLRVDPNPFSELTQISLSVENDVQSIALHIYDATGREVMSFRVEPHAQGSVLTWDGRNVQNKRLPSGVYFLKLEAGDNSATKKLLLVR